MNGFFFSVDGLGKRPGHPCFRQQKVGGPITRHKNNAPLWNTTEPPKRQGTKPQIPNSVPSAFAAIDSGPPFGGSTVPPCGPSVPPPGPSVQVTQIHGEGSRGELQVLHRVTCGIGASERFQKRQTTRLAERGTQTRTRTAEIDPRAPAGEKSHEILPMSWKNDGPLSSYEVL